ncbi:hypothetical protein [uncultured Sphingomonas sp.]|uniref:hypothetical protein n=1 Tax=uncultured Sphingomonas sp. TaxID=158754 RepID=UPI0035CB0F08
MAARVSGAGLRMRVLIAVPVWVIVGSADKGEPEDSLRDAFGKVTPGTEFVVMPGPGHLSPLAAADQLADAIRSAQTG